MLKIQFRRCLHDNPFQDTLLRRRNLPTSETNYWNFIWLQTVLKRSWNFRCHDRIFPVRLIFSIIPWIPTPSLRLASEWRTTSRSKNNQRRNIPESEFSTNLLSFPTPKKIQQQFRTLRTLRPPVQGRDRRSRTRRVSQQNLRRILRAPKNSQRQFQPLLVGTLQTSHIRTRRVNSQRQFRPLLVGTLQTLRIRTRRVSQASLSPTSLRTILRARPTKSPTRRVSSPTTRWVDVRGISAKRIENSNSRASRRGRPMIFNEFWKNRGETKQSTVRVKSRQQALEIQASRRGPPEIFGRNADGPSKALSKIPTRLRTLRASAETSRNRTSYRCSKKPIRHIDTTRRHQRKDRFTSQMRKIPTRNSNLLTTGRITRWRFRKLEKKRRIEIRKTSRMRPTGNFKNLQIQVFLTEVSRPRRFDDLFRDPANWKCGRILEVTISGGHKGCMRGV